MKPNEFSKLILVSMLAFSSVMGFSSKAADAAVKAEMDTGGNTRALVDPMLLPALERFPPQLALITRESVAEARALVNDMFTPRKTPGVSVTKRQINSNEGDISLHIYRPEANASNSPGILWIHGGGFIMGRADANDFA